MKTSRFALVLLPCSLLFLFQNCSGTRAQFGSTESLASSAGESIVTPSSGFDDIPVANDQGQIFHLQYPHRGLTAAQIGLIVNTNDEQSVAVAKYYQSKRGIPTENILEVSFPSGTTDMTAADLANLKLQIQTQMPATVQALALSWTTPWRVDGAISITAALAMDLAVRDIGCENGSPVNYPLDEALPFKNLSLRPAMMLAGTDLSQVQALIDRGVQADASFPDGDVYLIRTSDSLRSVARDQDFQDSVRLWNFADGLRSFYVNNSANTLSDLVVNTDHILLYETGLANVGGLTTNHYLPGAMADTLTSFSGMITGDNWQMSALRWLEAGITGSYGTVTEPCAIPNKFPQSSALLSAYFAGDTLIEAYWKSVHVYPQGLFIGEPLAKPFGTTAQWQDQKLLIRSSAFKPGKVYALFAAPSAEGPWQKQGENFGYDKQQWNNIEIANPQQAYYRIAEVVDDEAPVISSLTPNEGAEVQVSALTLQAVASDNSHQVVKVEYYLDSVLVATLMKAPFNAPINSVKYSNGNHVLEVRAYDPVGNMATQTHAFVINNPPDTTPPILNILSPSGFSYYTSREGVPVSVTMRDDRGLARLEIFDNTRKITTVSPNAKGIYKSNLLLISHGSNSHRLKFVLTDLAGNVTTKSVNLMVFDPVKKPLNAPPPSHIPLGP